MLSSCHWIGADREPGMADMYQGIRWQAGWGVRYPGAGGRCRPAARLGAGVYDAAADAGRLKPDLCSITTAGVLKRRGPLHPMYAALQAGCQVLGESRSAMNSKPRKWCPWPARRVRWASTSTTASNRPTACKTWVDEDGWGTSCSSIWGCGSRPGRKLALLPDQGLHPHTVDIMRYFCGGSRRCKCFGSRAPGRKIWSTAQS